MQLDRPGGDSKAYLLEDLGMHFTSLSLGFLICEMGIKRPAAQVCCRDDNAGKVQGLIPVTLAVQPPHLLLLPCENSQIRGRSRKAGTQNIKSPLSLFGEGDLPLVFFCSTCQTLHPRCPGPAGKGVSPYSARIRGSNAQGKNSQTHSVLQGKLGICTAPTHPQLLLSTTVATHLVAQRCPIQVRLQ